jgi:calcium permeable stress-gated cation channel
MINNLPVSLRSEETLRSIIPTPITNIWFPRTTKALDKLFEAREKECLALEGGEGKLLSLAAKNVRKNKLPPAEQARGDKALNPLAAKYVPAKKMPTHRLGPLAILFIGKKVPTLEYSPAFISEHNEKIAVERDEYRVAQREGVVTGGKYPLVNSAFVRFERMEDAHAFARDIKAMAGNKLIGAAVEVVPEDASHLPFLRSWMLTCLSVYRSSGVTFQCRR